MTALPNQTTLKTTRMVNSIAVNYLGHHPETNKCRRLTTISIILISIMEMKGERTPRRPVMVNTTIIILNINI